MSSPSDIKGQVFGRLTAIQRDGKSREGRAVWVFSCECGNMPKLTAKSVRSGNTRSCGCLHKDEVRIRMTTHGMSHSPEFTSWRGMMDRCNNPNSDAYKHYGGRGIFVCDRWHTFANFLADMGLKPSPRHTIERENNDGNYELGNCVWATMAVQSFNRRVNRIIEFRGKSMCLKEWEKELGIRYYTIHSRIKRGWPLELAMTTPASTAKVNMMRRQNKVPA